MLSRSGFSIRRFISQRRPHDNDTHEDVDFFHYGEVDSLKATHKDKTRMSRSKTKRSAPKPIVVIRRSASIHRISGPLPPLPDTPHSSASSLCSCEHHDQQRRLPGNRSPGLCSPRSKSLTPRSHSSSAGSCRVGRLSPGLNGHQKDDMDLPSDAAGSTFDLLEALALEPKTGSRPSSSPGKSSPKGSAVEENQPNDISENVQQLIRETDEAFHAVGSALAQANVASRVLSDTSSPISPTFTRPRKAPSPIGARSILLKASRQIPTPVRTPSRKSSLSKTSRKRSRRSRRREQQRLPALVSTKSISRWTLTDNVTELFNGKLFNRIEADEMLTPTQLQELKLYRISQLQAKRSTETLRTIETDGSDTPIEPFHLQDLPTRIGAAGVRLTIVSPVEDVPTPRSFDFGEQVVTQDFSMENKENKTEHSTTSSPMDPSDAMTYKSVSFPAPPTKNPLRSIPRRQLPPLPTIPEQMAAPPTDVLAPVPETSDEFIFFASSPFTLTMRTFRHGPIRLSKGDLCLEPKLPSDETLDWTAFQMAILGGAGDFFSDSTDYGRTREADEADELVSWLDSLGLDIGGLETMPPPPPTPWRRHKRSSPAGSPTPSATTAETAPSPPLPTPREMVQNLPIPLIQEHPNGFWNDSASSLDAGRFFAAQSMGIKRWTVEGHPKKYERGSADSLPQSPMFDLVTSRGHDGEEYVVPMGYNLGHDLGDFLRWEAENVYATGFLTE